MISREAVDLELPQRASADQEAWLEMTRISVRSIRFASCGAALHDRRAGPRLSSEALATSTDMLAASTRTLEVRHYQRWASSWCWCSPMRPCKSPAHQSTGCCSRL